MESDRVLSQRSSGFRGLNCHYWRNSKLAFLNFNPSSVHSFTDLRSSRIGECRSVITTLHHWHSHIGVIMIAVVCVCVCVLFQHILYQETCSLHTWSLDSSMKKLKQIEVSVWAAGHHKEQKPQVNEMNKTLLNESLSNFPLSLASGVTVVMEW